MTRKWTSCLSTAVVAICVVCQVRAQALTFTSEQAKEGEAAYEGMCARCHGADLQGGDFGPPLLGEAFIRHWAGRSLNSLLNFLRANMPPGNAGALPNATYSAILAYFLETYGVQSGVRALPGEGAQLDGLNMPETGVLEPYARSGGMGLSAGVKLPPWPPRGNPLKRITPVTDSTLKSPPESSWPSWRRTLDDSGFSPLTRITKGNVQRLRLSWSLALSPGPNETTPLVHDGVIFVQSFGDHIEALDAASGDELWHYHRELPKGTAPTVHRNMALYGENVYAATSDVQVVALRAKTGEVIWEQPIGEFNRGDRSDGGPIVANGIVMQGVNGWSQGGEYIVGLDAATGKLLWRFNTIARPGAPNGNSWNGVPLEKRTGGSVWTAGSYDSQVGLAFFGPAPTYDTGPLRKPVLGAGITNEALYTNATVALEPKTGKLVWYYQHVPNDQWDLDWAFERHVVRMSVNGSIRELVLTSGKEAVYDALDARTGAFMFSVDLGLQNLFDSIDPHSGIKSVKQDLIPGDDKTVMICPHEAGGKSWLPASYDARREILYVPLVDACMDLIPTRKGHGFLSTDVRPTVRPRPGSDGRYGRLQAIDFAGRTTVWTKRQRAPLTTGVLATAGGVLFAGSLDRSFTAFSADNGERLWTTRLSDAPNAAPITYLANGKQYVVVVTGAGFGQTEAFLSLVPEIQPPVAKSSTIWAFELPE